MSTTYRGGSESNRLVCLEGGGGGGEGGKVEIKLLERGLYYRYV